MSETNIVPRPVPSRIAQALLILTSLVALLNGAFMLWDPWGWYTAVREVKFTGPANPHFIRDIGLAYLSCAVVLAWSARDPARRWKAAIAGGLWLSLHGALHIWEVVTGICASDIFWSSAPGVLGPPMLVWLAVAAQLARGKNG
jgi:hypothetical protein